MQVDPYSCGHGSSMFLLPFCQKSHFFFSTFPPPFPDIPPPLKASTPLDCFFFFFFFFFFYCARCLDDTSDIQPVVRLLASRSISSQSGGVHLGECINGPPNLRQGYEADWIITVEAPVHYAPVSAQIEGDAHREMER